MPTLIGFLFLIAAAYLAVSDGSRLLELLIFSVVFQASAVFHSSSLGLQPYFVVATVYVMHTLLLHSSKIGAITHGRKLLLAFGAFGILSAFILPHVFAGLPVYDPKVGIDDGFFYRPPLTFGLGNLAQAAFLAIQILVVFSAGLQLNSPFRLARAYRFTFGFLVVIMLAQFLCQHFDINFPYELIQTNAGYAMASRKDELSRILGTFSEASYAGVAVVMYAAGFASEFFTKGKASVMYCFSLAMLVLVRSSSSLAAALIVTLVLILGNLGFRLPWHLDVRKTKRNILFVLGMVGCSLLVIYSPLATSLQEQTIEKSDSSSYINRTAADLFALQVAQGTHWIGVGLGSNRPSSLLTSLLSNLGVIGLALFFWMYFYMLRSVSKEFSWIKWSGFGVVLAMSFGMPDITAPLLWLPLILAASSGTS